MKTLSYRAMKNIFTDILVNAFKKRPVYLSVSAEVPEELEMSGMPLPTDPRDLPRGIVAEIEVEFPDSFATEEALPGKKEPAVLVVNNKDGGQTTYKYERAIPVGREIEGIQKWFDHWLKGLDVEVTDVKRGNGNTLLVKGSMRVKSVPLFNATRRFIAQSAGYRAAVRAIRRSRR